MTCDECREHLSAFLDRELDPYRQREVEAHLAGCPQCRVDLAALERISLALQDAPSPSEDLLPTRAVLSRLPALQTGRDRAADRAAFAAAGAAVLGLALALWLGLALAPGHLAVHLLTRITDLLYTLARGGIAPWLRTPGLGWELGGVAAGLLALNGLLVLATYRLWGPR
jgi:anti-sigma factor RsiW